MKMISLKTLLLIPVLLSLVIASGSLAAQVYKTVDEDGNVTYTDQPPGDGSNPITLKPISVIEAPTYEKAPDPAKAGGEGEEIPLRNLRKIYRDFAIISPQSEESVWRPDGPVSVAWSVGNPLQQGMQVTIYLDGAKQATTTDQIIPVDGLERGEHTVTAELKDAKNRRIATAQPVVFFIQRPNIYTNRPRPRGGG